MDMIRHHSKRMQFIVPEDARVIQYRLYDLVGNRWLAKVEGARASLIEQAIQGSKCLPGRQRPSAKRPMLR
jgi:hypothetical protein